GAGMTMTELSRFLMVSNGNVTGIIDRLVAEGMVVRSAHEGDRRATFVRLTPKGATQFAAMARAHEAGFARFLLAFPAPRPRASSLCSALRAGGCVAERVRHEPWVRTCCRRAAGERPTRSKGEVDRRQPPFASRRARGGERCLLANLHASSTIRAPT